MMSPMDKPILIKTMWPVAHLKILSNWVKFSTQGLYI